MKSWQKRIDEAKKRGRFTQEDALSASYWRTCAIGELTTERQRGVILRTDAPHGELYQLGLSFAVAVMDDSIEKAGDLYRQIRERVGKK